MIDGLPDACAAVNAAGKSAVFSTTAPKAAKAKRVGNEIRIAKCGRNHAAWIVALLMHADGAIDAVVGDQDNYRQLILNCRGKVLPRHQEVAISGNTDNDAIAKERLHCERGGQAVSH